MFNIYSSTKIYNIFISHSWKYSRDYYRVENMINSTGLNWRNYSVPQDDPIHNAPNDIALRAAIDRQMRSASGVILLAGVYASYSKWINIEIEMAKAYNKPIIAIELYGAEKTTQLVRSSSITIPWRTDSLKNAIERVF